VLAARRAAGHDDERHPFRVRLRDRAEGVLDTGSVLATEHRDLVAGAHAPDGVGHRAADTLLTDDDRPNVHGGREFRQRVQRVREQDVDAFTLQDVRNDLTDVHGLPPVSFVSCVSRGRALPC
jgi:hypothetical protein